MMRCFRPSDIIIPKKERNRVHLLEKKWHKVGHDYNYNKGGFDCLTSGHKFVHLLYMVQGAVKDIQGVDKK